MKQCDFGLVVEELTKGKIVAGYTNELVFIADAFSPLKSSELRNIADCMDATCLPSEKTNEQ